MPLHQHLAAAPGDVHPTLVNKPTDWGCVVSYGIPHVPEPTPLVQELLGAVRDEQKD